MGSTTVQFCDVCKKDKNVAPVVVVREYGKRAPWEADICADCYQDLFGVLMKASRRPITSNVRPPHRFNKVEITEDNL